MKYEAGGFHRGGGGGRRESVSSSPSRPEAGDETLTQDDVLYEEELKLSVFTRERQKVMSTQEAMRSITQQRSLREIQFKGPPRPFTCSQCLFLFAFSFASGKEPKYYINR